MVKGCTGTWRVHSLRHSHPLSVILWFVYTWVTTLHTCIYSYRVYPLHSQPIVSMMVLHFFSISAFIYLNLSFSDNSLLASDKKKNNLIMRTYHNYNRKLHLKTTLFWRRLLCQCGKTSIPSFKTPPFVLKKTPLKPSIGSICFGEDYNVNIQNESVMYQRYRVWWSYTILST